MHIYPWQIDLTSKLIEHRCHEYCYIKLGRYTPHQLTIDPLNTITPNLADLLADLPPWSIEHRCHEYHYTKLGRSTPSQSGIDALNTATPNLSDLLPPHQSSIDPLNTPTINLADLLPDLPPTSAMHHGTYIMGYIWQPFWILQQKVVICFYF